MPRTRTRSVVTAVATLVSLATVAGGCSRGDDAAAPAEPTPPDIEAVDCGVADEPRAVPDVEPPAEIPTELVVEVLRDGIGRPAADGDTLYVDFVGIRAEDGAVVDSSYGRDVPMDLVLGRSRVMEGWDLGLVDATTGSMIRLDVPGDLAYGDTPPGDPVQPGDALSFVIEVRAVVPPTTADDAPLDLDIEPSTGAVDVGVTDLEVGEGEIVEMGDTAIVHALLVRGDNLVVLLSTWERDDPLLIELTDPPNAMAGLVQGLQCARVGGRRVIELPPTWAFGPDGEPGLGLPAGSDLIVVVDVVGAY